MWTSCQITALWRCFPSNKRTCSNGIDIFCMVHAGGYITRNGCSVESAASYNCEKREAGRRGQGQLGNPEEGECLPLEAAAKQ
jgi:hypothetical protein